MFDEQIKIIQKAERVRTLFEVLLETMGLTYEANPKDVFVKMREIHEAEQEATRVVATMGAKGYKEPKIATVRKKKPKVVTEGLPPDMADAYKAMSENPIDDYERTGAEAHEERQDINIDRDPVS